MNNISTFTMQYWDYLAFGLYFLFLSIIGYWAGRREKENSSEYFLAGRTLPWYVVGSSFIAANISSEHFIGMIGAAFVYGICVATPEWSRLIAFSFLIWIFIPFLLTARVFTTPEFLEKRFNSVIRQFFAGVTIIANVVAFLAAVLYGYSQIIWMEPLVLIYRAWSCGWYLGDIRWIKIGSVDGCADSYHYGGWWFNGNNARIICAIRRLT